MSAQVDPRKFRDALSTFATGVTIVTARDAAGEPVGMTASSFNSVSMDPPLVLWSVTKTALSASAFKAAAHWAVHVLSTDQVELSNRFASSGVDKFSEVDWSDDAHGVPVIAGCVARFGCRAWAAYEGGDHWILVGEVLELASEPREPLVFSSGSYAVAESIRTPSSSDLAPTADDGAAIEDLLMYQLSRATRQMSQQFHESVRKSGLSVAEWRVLASMHGPTTRDLEDLGARTFLDSRALVDLLHALGEQGLCTFDLEADPPVASGTRAGHDRVSHLFELGAGLELAAIGDVGDDGARQLKEHLRTIVRNTST